MVLAKVPLMVLAKVPLRQINVFEAIFHAMAGCVIFIFPEGGKGGNTCIPPGFPPILPRNPSFSVVFWGI